MTHVLITVDTELSAGRQARGLDVRRNFESSILGRSPGGDVGTGWLMDRLEAHGLRGVFFVDPLPALVHGVDVIAQVVGPIVERGHEVQLHIHTEWLEWAKDFPVGGRQGRNLGDFTLDDQIVLLGLAADLLVRAGAPRPTAFRAGNYGANDDSIRALGAIGIGWDSSVNPAFLGGDCRVSLSRGQTLPIARDGVVLLPVSALFDRPGHIRPAQVCALSAGEMTQALGHAARHAHGAFVIVTHSFEMLARDRLRANGLVMRRFETMCRTIAAHPHLHGAGFRDLDRAALLEAPAMQERLPSSLVRTARRQIEQAVGTWRYERRLIPA